MKGLIYLFFRRVGRERINELEISGVLFGIIFIPHLQTDFVYGTAKDMYKPKISKVDRSP